MKEELINIKPEDKIATNIVKRYRKSKKVEVGNDDVKGTHKFAQMFNSESLLKEEKDFPKLEDKDNQDLVDAIQSYIDEIYIDEILLVESATPAPVTAPVAVLEEILLEDDTLVTPAPVAMAVVEDCRQCVNCRDKKKYGGPNTRKQSCVLKPKSGSRKRKNRPE